MTIPSGLYPILDLDALGDRDPLPIARAVLSAGSSWLQVRGKGASDATVFSAARALAGLKAEFSYHLMINHALSVAEAVSADGVHLTRQSPAIAEARARLGAAAIIGYSAHSLEEAQAAQAAGADYVSLGAIFPTPNKADGHPVHGIAGLARVVSAVSIPVIAVGGIDRTTVPLLRTIPGAGPVHGFSGIRALLHADAPAIAAADLQGLWDNPTPINKKNGG